MVVTFVCLGNICRSPMAEFIFKDLVGRDLGPGGARRDFGRSEILVQSAGISGENDGCGVHFGTAKILRAKNIAVGDFVSKKLTQKMCDESDYIVVMDDGNLRGVLRFENVAKKTLKICDFAKNLGYENVPDPWYSGDFDETYKILSVACANLLEFLKNR